jgi:hypothetical protein
MDATVQREVAASNSALPAPCRRSSGRTVTSTTAKCGCDTGTDAAAEPTSAPSTEPRNSTNETDMTRHASTSSAVTARLGQTSL